MNYRYLIIFGLLGGLTNANYAASSSDASAQEVRQQKLARWGNRFGNKTANMKLLQDDVKEFPNARVPNFFGLGSDEIITALQGSGAWAHILEEWHAFQEALRAAPNTLSNETKSRLSSIRGQIDQQQFDLGSICVTEKRQTVLNAFISKASAENYLLMVRSTGREDGKELSNAGGNASVASVNPQGAAISDAIKVVLSSYFSEKSIMQRLVGGDTNLASGEPFMPVLLQFMMGEGSGQYPDEIPHSGVIYSTEGEGNTPGVTIIQSTLGHNEAVVNGLAPVDTYYISKNSVINPVIRVKQSRLKTVNGELELVPNPSNLTRASTLSATQVRRLKLIADRLEEKYGYPVDIEFVIIKETIYLVQARPLEEKDMAPSYLAKEYFDALSESDKIMGTTIGVGNAQAHYITNHQEVIVAENIRKALATYLELVSKDPENKYRIKSIIVGEMAPSTSHEANQFRGQKKSVLYLQNFGAVKAWAKEQRPFFVDPQRGVVALATSGDSKAAIKEGWFVHPIPQQISVHPEFFIDAKPEYPTDSVAWKEFDGMLKDVPDTISLNNLLNFIQHGDIEVASESCDYLLIKVMRAIRGAQNLIKKKIAASTETNKYLGTHLEGLLRQFYLVINEQKAVLSKPGFTEIERLYPLTFINALLKQIPDKALITNFSLGSLLKTEKMEQQALTVLDLKGKPLRDYFVQYAKATDFALVDELKTAWQNYLKDLVQNTDAATQQHFTTMIYDLAVLDTLPLWINTSFVHAARGGSTGPSLSSSSSSTSIAAVETGDITANLLSEFDRSHDFLAQLTQINDYFRPFPVGSFDEPAAFEKQWKLFSDKLRSLVLSESFISQLDVTDRLGKLAAIQTLNTVVATFDNSIKALTGSTKYLSAEEKYKQVERFKRMLGDYFELLKKTATLNYLREEINAMCPDEFKPKHTWTTEQLQNAYIIGYLNAIKTMLDDTPIDPEQMIASTAFIGSAAVLGSGADWRRSIGTDTSRHEMGGMPTLENLFTLIHQNLLMVFAALSKKTGLAAIQVPPLVTQLRNTMERQVFAGESQYHTKYATFIGVSFTKDQLSFLYNISLRQHSNTFQINYNPATRKLTFDFQFYGHNEMNRWNKIACLSYIIGEYLGLPLSRSIDIQDNSLSIGFAVQSSEQIQLLSKLLYKATDITFEGAGKGLPHLFHDLRHQLPDMKGMGYFKLFAESARKNMYTNPELFGSFLLQMDPFGPEEKAAAYRLILQCLKAPNLPRVALEGLIHLCQQTGAPTDVLNRMLKHPNDDIKGVAIHILTWGELSETTYATLVTRLAPDNSPYLASNLFELWHKLSYKGLIPTDDRALAPIITLVKTGNPEIVKAFLEHVAVSLVRQNKEIELVQQVALEKLNDARRHTRESSVNVIHHLIEHRIGDLDQILAALRAAKNIDFNYNNGIPLELLRREDLTPSQENQVIEIFVTLIKQGKYPKETSFGSFGDSGQFDNPQLVYKAYTRLHEDHALTEDLLRTFINTFEKSVNENRISIPNLQLFMRFLESIKQDPLFEECYFIKYIEKTVTRAMTEETARQALVEKISTYQPTEKNEAEIEKINQNIENLAVEIENIPDISPVVEALERMRHAVIQYNADKPKADKISINTEKIVKALSDRHGAKALRDDQKALLPGILALWLEKDHVALERSIAALQTAYRPHNIKEHLKSITQYALNPENSLTPIISALYSIVNKASTEIDIKPLLAEVLTRQELPSEDAELLANNLVELLRHAWLSVPALTQTVVALAEAIPQGFNPLAPIIASLPAILENGTKKNVNMQPLITALRSRQDLSQEDHARLAQSASAALRPEFWKYQPGDNIRAIINGCRERISQGTFDIINFSDFYDSLPLDKLSIADLKEIQSFLDEKSLEVLDFYIDMVKDQSMNAINEELKKRTTGSASSSSSTPSIE